ncbi:MAG: bifunctional riboflavin kinase/FAD synthetase [Dehalococcoidales bacterium]|nr:bifunctional riboflavin kinase/FAD synthetase [Dehalococcoidales bacterium]
MLLIEEELAAISPDKGTLLTIGVFDGVHIGHKHLISQLRSLAETENLASGVVTFRQHPLEVLAPGTVPPYLTSCKEKVELLKAEKVDYVIPLTFTREMADLSAREFVSLLRKYLKMQGLVVGMDFTLGKDREGDIPMLRELGNEMGFSVTEVSAMDFSDEIVSSTVIRQYLQEGDIKTVAKFLGRTFSLHGIVTRGDARGRTLGFPTANIAVDSVQSLLPAGVYATWIYIDGKAYASVTNIGERPTFGDNDRTVETYVIDYQGDLYDRELKLDIIDLLRRETRFENAGELKKQIAEDIENSKAVLGLQTDKSCSTCSC